MANISQVTAVSVRVSKSLARRRLRFSQARVRSTTQRLEGGQVLIARGVVTSAEAIAKKRGIARQTPRVSLTIRRTALAKRPLGRSEHKHFTDWNDGQPGTELNFKLYRQATNKIVGISDESAAFLSEFF